jgi:hypothetical protein
MFPEMYCAMINFWAPAFGVKLDYMDYWTAMATDQRAPLIGADKSHPLYGCRLLKRFFYYLLLTIAILNPC